MLVYMDGDLTLNYYWTGYSRTPVCKDWAKAWLYRAWPWTRTRPRTRTRPSHWIAYKQFVWSRFHQRRPRTRLEIGSCGTVAGLPLERVFRRWSHELFLVNQSVLLFSWNSAQVLRRESCIGGSEAPLLGGGICHIHDASVKSVVLIYPCISSFFSSSSVWKGKIPKWHPNLSLTRLLPFSWDVHASTHCGCPLTARITARYRVLYKRWFVRTFYRKVARKVAMAVFSFMVVLCINMPLLSLYRHSLLRIKVFLVWNIPA